MISKSCEYAFRATIFGKEQSTKKGNVIQSEMALKIHSPLAFTAVLHKAMKANVEILAKGSNSELYVEQANLNRVNLLKGVYVIDFDVLFVNFSLGYFNCEPEKTLNFAQSVNGWETRNKKNIRKYDFRCISSQISEWSNFLN
ncbi:hypothetical protein [Halpernia sp. GG3]